MDAGMHQRSVGWKTSPSILVFLPPAPTLLRSSATHPLAIVHDLACVLDQQPCQATSPTVRLNPISVLLLDSIRSIHTPAKISASSGFTSEELVSPGKAASIQLELVEDARWLAKALDQVSSLRSTHHRDFPQPVAELQDVDYTLPVVGAVATLRPGKMRHIAVRLRQVII
ncbi:hypothetical protein FPHYL_13476 [Fusarium phyllophilum]|uniref:Uncharacterized protein n=1 Tax=Fusarium phyllophilum TaxID=47803 RepID=A0A8H5IGU0_9HYPO|nr:hypothetical protein FPHYL_13476 [Fusarium phyllophilum]